MNFDAVETTGRIPVGGIGEVKGRNMPKDKINEKTTVALYISPGVLVDGGGIMIVGGKVIHIPPRGPLLGELIGVLNKIAAGKVIG